jgi:hypothetical protein
MKKYHFSIEELTVYIYPEANADGSFTGAWNYMIDDEKLTLQIADNSGFTTAAAAEAEARNYADYYLEDKRERAAWDDFAEEESKRANLSYELWKAQQATEIERRRKDID